MLLIIGYGNVLRSDDGVGCHISECLRQMIFNPDVEILSEHQLTPELVEPVSRADWLIFIDACEGTTAGEIHSWHIEPCAEGSGKFTHNVHPAGLLAASQELYGRYPDAEMISITAESFEFGEMLSPAVRAAVLTVLDQIQQKIEEKIVSHA